MQVETPEAGGKQANTSKPFSLRMLSQRVSTVQRQIEADDCDLVAIINGRQIPLDTGNFQMADDGKLELALPESWIPICSRPKRSEEAYDLELRTLQIVDMASVLATEELDTTSLDEPLESFLEVLLDRPVRHPSLEALSVVLSAPGWEKEDYEDQADHNRQVLAENAYEADRAGLHGFGVQFGTPRRRYTSATSYSSSFGHMKTAWLYADSFEEAWSLGVEWARSSHAKDLQESGFAGETSND